MSVAALIFLCPEEAFSAYMSLEGLCDVAIYQPGQYPEDCIEADVLFIDAAVLSLPGADRLLECFPQQKTRWCVLTPPERPMVSVGNLSGRNFATECGPLTPTMANRFIAALTESALP